MYNIIIFKTIGFKLTASGNITHYKITGNMTGIIKGLWDRSEFYGYLKIKKSKNSKLTKIKREKFQSIKEWTFHYKFFYFQLIV